MSRTKKRRGIIVGFEYYGKYLAHLMNEHSNGWSFKYSGASYPEKLRAALTIGSADALVCFGGPGPDAVLAEIARRNNVPVIVIWAGTDVITAGADPGLLEVIKQEGFVNVADGPWLVDELKSLGIQARYVPVTAVVPSSYPAPIPKTFRILSYLPEPRRSFYGEKSVYAVARAFPEIPFSIVGKGGANPGAPANVEFLGYVHNMREILDQSAMLLRLPIHDGKSMLVLESLSRGRHVVWTYGFPGVRKATNVSEAIAQVRDLYEAHQRGALELNLEGHAYVRENFARPTLASNFEAVLEAVLLDEVATSKREPKKEAARRVVISGFNLFTAQIAKEVSDSTLGWEPHVLRASRKLERLASLGHLLRADVWYTIGSPITDRWLHLVARVLRKPRVVHWVGSDIQTLKRCPGVLQWCRRDDVRHLAEVDWMIEELRALGLKANLAPLPPRTLPPAAPPPLPERFTVLLYMPRHRGEFYGCREYQRLFRTFAGRPIKFIIVGGGEFYAPEDTDVEDLGWCTDLRSVYERTSVLLRFTRHDGLSLMALEALSYGRHVLWTQEFPFTTRVQTYHECEREISSLLERHLAGTLEPQLEMAQYIRETYDSKRCVERIANAWEEAAQKRPLPLKAIEAQP